MTTSTLESGAREPVHTLECMEIWGGNRAVEDAVSVHGLDAWIYSRPHAEGESGGDIHYVSMCGSGRIARFAVADVAGHGETVGDLAGKLRGLMKKNVNRIDQTRFARALNRQFADLAQDGVFATAILATYWAPTDHLITCNAGHPPPLWYHATSKTWQSLVPDGEGTVPEAVNLPLGVIEPTDFHQFAVRLDKGDLLLLYTDSLIEAKREGGTTLGIAGLIDLVSGLEVDPFDQLPRRVVDAVADYRGGQPSDDDETVMLLHHNAADPPMPSLGSMAKSIGKMFGLVKM